MAKNTQTEQTTDIVIPGAAVELASSADVMEFIKAEWGEDTNSALEAIVGQLDRIFTGETAEQIFADDDDVISWRDKPWKPYKLTGGIRFLDSDPKYINDNTIVPKFAVVMANDMETGEQVLLSSGATLVVGALRRGFLTGQLKDTEVVLKEYTTRKGFTGNKLITAADWRKNYVDKQ